jgi:hypothetical protein
MPLQKNIFESASLLDTSNEKKTQGTQKKISKKETNYLLKMIAKKIADDEDELEELEEEIKPKQKRNYTPEARQKMEERLAKVREKSMMTRKAKADEKKNKVTKPTPQPPATPAPTPSPVQDSKTSEDLKKALAILHLQNEKIKELNGKLSESSKPKEQVKEQVKEPVKQPVKETKPQVIPGQEWWRNL